MKLFLIAGIVPFKTHGEPGVTAAHVVTYALITELQKLGYDVTVQCLLHQSRETGHLSPAEQASIAGLTVQGIHMLPPIYLSDHFARRAERFRSLRLLLQQEKAIAHFYPGFAVRALMADRVQEAGADVIVPVWSPQGVAATHGLSVPRVAYHGDVDYEPSECRLVLDPDLFAVEGGGILQAIDARLRLQLYRKAHLALIHGLTAIANITDCNAKLYASQGHQHSVYVRNTWIDTPSPVVTRAPLSDRPITIIGHTGYLDKTGGTYGLQFLLKEVLPALDTLLVDRPFEVHIIGGGQVMPALRSFTTHPKLHWKGFVEDLESELASADVFCLFNNAGRYKAAYTRHLVAWANRLCLIAHAGSKLAIPEIEHERNALLVQDGMDAARQIVRAATDIDLNQRLRAGGRATYEQFFQPHTVAKNLDIAIRSVTQ